MHSYKGGILWPAQQHQTTRVHDNTIISVVKKNILPSKDCSRKYRGFTTRWLHSGTGGGQIRLCRLKTSKTASERQNFGANETMINYFYLLMMWLLIEVAGGILKFKSFTLQNWSDGASRRKRIMTRSSPRVSRRKQMGFPSAAKSGTWSQPKRIKLKAEKWTNNNNQEWVR